MLEEPQCFKRNCKFFEGVEQPDGTERTEQPVCKAFPEGIPATIAYGNNLHLKPFRGDNGIQYKRGEA